MAKFSREELKVIRKAKLPGFAVYLMYCSFFHDCSQDEITKGEYPSRERLSELSDKLRMNKSRFDIVYNTFLPTQSVNPLAEEQEAWRRLAPDLEGWLNGFNRFLEKYSNKGLKEEDKIRAESYLDIWWALHQEWNAISNSYKLKIEQVYTDLSNRGVRSIRETS